MDPRIREDDKKKEHFHSVRAELVEAPGTALTPFDEPSMDGKSFAP